MAIKGTWGGSHPLKKTGEGKLQSRDVPIEEFAAQTVCIPMGMHIGAPSKPCVAKGDYVKIGQVIGEPVGALGLPVHASVSGEVLSVEPKPYMSKDPVVCVTIQNDFTDTWVDLTPLGDVQTVAVSDIIPAIKAAGISGLGGASFPTHVKLSIPKGKKCDTILVNGSECETHVTSDYRVMLETPLRVVKGTLAAMRAAGAEKGIIGLEDNKPEAVAAMREAAAAYPNITVEDMETKYCQGCEQMLISTLLRREVPTGGLPIDAGVVVINSSTAAAICDAITKGKPLVSRVVTVTGNVKNAGNLLLRIGTTFQDAIDHCGGWITEPGKIISGGALMGAAVPNAAVPVSKGTSCILVFDEAQSHMPSESLCIRCGRCTTVCPMGLLPYQLRVFCDKNDIDSAKEYNLMSCMSCGNCAYSCPSHRLLTSVFKNTKASILAKGKGGKDK